MLKWIWLLFLACNISIQAITITSLNIKWYGRGGDMRGSAESESRDENLRDFLFNQMPQTDVFVFQEITKPEMLSNALYELNCKTYEPKIKPHQHVVICTQPYYDQKSKANLNVLLERHRLRPSLESVISEDFQVIGVHLKASPQSWKTRKDQVKALLNTTRFKRKSIIIGDFNTYDRDATRASKDDHEIYQKILSKKKFKIVKPDAPTYVGRNNRIFDRAWARGYKRHSLKTYGPCKKNSVSFPYNEKARFLEMISDHCAIQVRLN